ncbi:hypothetical protein ACJX0J_006632, partial [Zea mays]
MFLLLFIPTFESLSVTGNLFIKATTTPIETINSWTGENNFVTKLQCIVKNMYIGYKWGKKYCTKSQLNKYIQQPSTLSTIAQQHSMNTDEIKMKRLNANSRAKDINQEAKNAFINKLFEDPNREL